MPHLARHRLERAFERARPIPRAHHHSHVAGGWRRPPIITPMRVLVVAASPPWPLTDGASLVLHHYLRRLASRHEITVLAAARPPGAAEPRRAAVGLPDGVDVRWLGPGRAGVLEYARRRWGSVRTGEPADAFRVATPALLAAFRHELEARPPALVHLHGWGTAVLVPRVGDVPVVHMSIDAWSAGYGTQYAVPAWRRVLETGQRRKVAAHERRHYPACHAVVVVAPRDRDALRMAVPSARVEVVPIGVERTGPDLDPADQPVLGFHGALSTPANADAAVFLVREVLPRVQVRHPRARAIIVGRDPPQKLTRLAAPDVEVTGAVPDIPSAMAGVAVYVAPLVSGMGVKIKVLEAMSLGLPVVATPRALNGIGEGPWARIGTSADQMSEAISGLLADAEERRRLGRAGRERVAAMTWDVTADAIDAIWTDAVVTS